MGVQVDLSKQNHQRSAEKCSKNASSTAFVFSLYNHLDGFTIFMRVAWWSNLGRGIQANRTEHNHKEPLPNRGLAGGVSPERKRGGQRHGRVGGRGGRVCDKQGHPRPPPKGEGPRQVDRLLSTTVEQDGKRFWCLRQEGSASDQVQVSDPPPEVHLGPGFHPDLHKRNPWRMSLRRIGGVDSSKTAAICEEKWT